jgi:hypothetical protein
VQECGLALAFASHGADQLDIRDRSPRGDGRAWEFDAQAECVGCGSA